MMKNRVPGLTELCPLEAKPRNFSTPVLPDSDRPIIPFAQQVTRRQFFNFLDPLSQEPWKASVIFFPNNI